MADTGTSVVLTILLSAVFLATVLFNCLLLYVYMRSRELWKAPNLLLLNLAAADLLAAFFWLLPAIVAAASSAWLLGSGMCVIQGFVMTICYCSNMHTLLLVSFEKALRICWPSRHHDVFYNTVVLIMIAALWTMDLVFSLFPLIGWSKIRFFERQYQCSYDYVQSISHLNFMFIMVYVFPIILGIVCYIALLYKVKKIQTRVDPRGNIILEENEKAPKLAYSDKLQRQENKFKYAPLKRNKPQVAGEKITGGDERFGEDLVTSSSEDERQNEPDWMGGDYRPRRRQAEQRRNKRLFKYHPQVTKLALSIGIVWLVYVLCWFPYYVLSYYWVLNVLNQPADAAHRALTLFTFLGLVIKVPLLYITNKRFRLYTKKAFQKNEKEKDKLAAGRRKEERVY